MIRIVCALGLLAGCDQVFGGGDFIAPAHDGPAAPDADTSGCLRDTFSDGQIDPQKWAISNPGSPITVTERDDHLVLSLAPRSTSDVGYVASSLYAIERRDLRNAAVFVELVSPVNLVAGHGENYLSLYIDAESSFGITTGGQGSIVFVSRVNGVTTFTKRSWALTDHFWRIRHEASVGVDGAITNHMFFETGAGPDSFEIWHTVHTTGPLAPVIISLGAGSYQGGTDSPGAAIYDNFQLITGACPYLPIES